MDDSRHSKEFRVEMFRSARITVGRPYTVMSKAVEAYRLCRADTLYRDIPLRLVMVTTLIDEGTENASNSKKRTGNGAKAPKARAHIPASPHAVQPATLPDSPGSTGGDVKERSTSGEGGL